jgi:hypothetical protein
VKESGKSVLYLMILFGLNLPQTLLTCQQIDLNWSQIGQKNARKIVKIFRDF